MSRDNDKRPAHRPPLPADKRRSDLLRVRVQAGTRTRYEAAAAAAGLGLSEWVRRALAMALGDASDEGEGRGD